MKQFILSSNYVARFSFKYPGFFVIYVQYPSYTNVHRKVYISYKACSLLKKLADKTFTRDDFKSLFEKCDQILVEKMLDSLIDVGVVIENKSHKRGY